MQKINSFFRRIGIPSKKEILRALESFSKKEWYIFLGLGLVLLASVIIILVKINNKFLVTVPTRGGTITEGIIGTPRFINPVLATSDIDKDLTSLVYSGLVRKLHDGSIAPDLAESYDISKNGLVYTFKIKEGAVFHDGVRVTSEDVVFTIKQAQDPTLKSPKKANWEGVTIEATDEKTVVFTLKQAYSLFLENATIGILPKHLWSEIPAEQFSLSTLNTEGVGTGPYKIRSVSKKSSGVPSLYTFKSFNKSTLGEPYIKKITVKFYANENSLVRAIENGDVNQISAISGENSEMLSKKDYRMETAVLPRVFGIFFNQNENKIFTDRKVIEAFSHAINKKEIIDTALFGHGAEIDTPSPDVSATDEYNVEIAESILDKAGWTKGDDGIRRKKNGKESTTLEFSIETSDTPELTKTANIIKKNLESIGVQVEVKVFDIGSLNQNVIRPRKYDALLFGQIIGFEPNFFAFWHSTQRNDPGLNVAGYTNSKTDKILESVLAEQDQSKRLEKYEEFINEWKKDKSAILIYAPEFVYLVDERLKGLELSHITNASDRFNEINRWYLETDRIWKFFIKK